MLPRESYWGMIAMVVCFLSSSGAAKRWIGASVTLNQIKWISHLGQRYFFLGTSTSWVLASTHANLTYGGYCGGNNESVIPTEKYTFMISHLSPRKEKFTIFFCKPMVQKYLLRAPMKLLVTIHFISPHLMISMKKRNGIVVDYNVDHYKRGYFPPLREDNYLLSSL